MGLNIRHMHSTDGVKYKAYIWHSDGVKNKHRMIMPDSWMRGGGGGGGVDRKSTRT